MGRRPRIRAAVKSRRETLYAALGVAPGAAAESIRAAYLELAIKLHPDKPEGDAYRFAGITAAYAVLKDPARRRLYDLELALYPDKCKGCNGTGLRLKSQGFSRRYSYACPTCEGTGWEETI